MVAKIKIFYQENKMWMYLAQYMLISLALAIFAILLDVRYIPVLKYIPDLFLTSVDLAKLILSTLAGSLLTITTFTFSTIMVVLTMYSSNFSPRVVSNFLTEKITMKVLGIFIGGFFYCLLTLFFMKKTYAEVLVISATIGVIYAVLCIIYFVVFVYTVASSVQASKLISRLYDESTIIIDKTLSRRQGFTTLDEYDPEYFGFSYDILSNYSGYLVLIEFEEILRSITDYDADVVINKEIGDFISKNQKLATLYSNKAIDDKQMLYKLISRFNVEEERLDYNDYRYSIQKIVDITLRALSPGINDPNTAIHCINILGVILGKLGEIEGRYTVLKDKKSDSKIIYEDFNFKEELFFTFNQIVHYGKADISVMIAIFNALNTINISSSDDKNETIYEFADYVYENAIGSSSHSFDKQMLNKAKSKI